MFPYCTNTKILALVYQLGVEQLGGGCSGRMLSRKWWSFLNTADVPATLANCLGDGVDASTAADWTDVWKVDNPGEQAGSNSDTEEDGKWGVSWLAGGKTGRVLATVVPHRASAPETST